MSNWETDKNCKSQGQLDQFRWICTSPRRRPIFNRKWNRVERHWWLLSYRPEWTSRIPGGVRNSCITGNNSEKSILNLAEITSPHTGAWTKESKGTGSADGSNRWCDRTCTDTTCEGEASRYSVYVNRLIESGATRRTRYFSGTPEGVKPRDTSMLCTSS